MMVLIAVTGRVDSFVQLITVLIIFVGVLAAAFFTSKWIAGYQKQHRGANIEVIETSALANGKYIQIVRLADTYVAIAICKDTVTVLATLPKDEIEFPSTEDKKTLNFKELFQRAKENEKDKQE